jgi:hypothetical protein
VLNVTLTHKPKIKALRITGRQTEKKRLGGMDELCEPLVKIWHMVLAVAKRKVETTI